MSIFGGGNKGGAVVWERLYCKKEGPNGLFRAKVFGGWLVYTEWAALGRDTSYGFTFMPDPEHQWDGTSD